VSADEQVDAAYQDVKEVRSVGRGVGLWGDMVVVLKNGDKVELRALPRLVAFLLRPCFDS
jgi:nitrogen fixation protein